MQTIPTILIIVPILLLILGAILYFYPTKKDKELKTGYTTGAMCNTFRIRMYETKDFSDNPRRIFMEDVNNRKIMDNIIDFPFNALVEVKYYEGDERDDDEIVIKSIFCLER